MREELREGPRPLTLLARFRVALGFGCGVIVFWLAQPTWRSMTIGGIVALLGEAIRIWAAGHVEKGREVTTSGPYRWIRHPLYVGSSIMGVGLALAAANVGVLVVVAVYLALTLTAAIWTEESWLRRKFGSDYQAYVDGREAGAPRRFSLNRALVTNREHRAVVGLAVAMALLALKAR